MHPSRTHAHAVSICYSISTRLLHELHVQVKSCGLYVQGSSSMHVHTIHSPRSHTSHVHERRHFHSCMQHFLLCCGLFHISVLHAVVNMARYIVKLVGITVVLLPYTVCTAGMVNTARPVACTLMSGVSAWFLSADVSCASS